MFQTFLDNEAYDDDGSFFVFLGTVRNEKIPKERAITFQVVHPEMLQAIKTNPIEKYKHGITIVIGLANYNEYKKSIDAIQKHLAYIYCKYILFPRISTTIPDQYGIRKEEPLLLIPREINKAKNIPLYLQYPLCNKLKGVGKEFPVAVLLPGPSLNRAAPFLEEIKNKCLLVCVARTLDFCLRANVEPDIVINLDTVTRMKHFLDVDRRLKNTYLIALSPGPLAEVAQNFRGTFFIDSFDTDVLPNYFRLRESWLSCSISALGIAELLQTKSVILIGGDHSWQDDSNSEACYWDTGTVSNISRNKSEEFPQTLVRQQEGDTRKFFLKTHKESYQAFPALVKNIETYVPLGVPEKAIIHTELKNTPRTGDQPQYSTFELQGRNGENLSTYFNYFAISAEMEYVAQEISQSNGTVFYLFEETGILEKDVFRSGGLELLKELGIIYKDAFIKRADKVLGIKERIDHKKFIKKQNDLITVVSEQSAHISICLFNGKITDALEHPFSRSIDVSSAQRKYPSVRDYRFRVKHDGDYAFYEHQSNRLEVDSEEFPLLKQEFYRKRIAESRSSVTMDNFDNVRKLLFEYEDRWVVEATLRACEVWVRNLRQGIAACRFFKALKEKEKVVLWCLQEEKVNVLKNLTMKFGQFIPHFACLSLREEFISKSQTLENVYIDDFLLFTNTCQMAQVATESIMKKFDYLFEQADTSKIFCGIRRCL